MGACIPEHWRAWPALAEFVARRLQAKATTYSLLYGVEQGTKAIQRYTADILRVADLVVSVSPGLANGMTIVLENRGDLASCTLRWEPQRITGEPAGPRIDIDLLVEYPSSRDASCALFVSGLGQPDYFEEYLGISALLLDARPWLVNLALAVSRPDVYLPA